MNVEVDFVKSFNYVYEKSLCKIKKKVYEKNNSMNVEVDFIKSFNYVYEKKFMKKVNEKVYEKNNSMNVEVDFMKSFRTYFYTSGVDF
jgi:hypothetical protein